MKSKISKFLVAGLLYLTGIPAPAQTMAETQQNGRAVTCTVTDDLGPVTGANILVKGSKNGTITDIDGKATLHGVPSNATLVVSFIGYATQEVNIGERSIVTITLKENALALNEVVVVGYGTQKKVNLTGAVDQVGEKTFENRSVANVTQALQGVVPNLNISLEDGKPTRSASYNVRGTTSIGQGGSALVLIDGVEGDPALLNPNDIASVSVLKDAASAAIYGARGAFGVVLITTKSPQKGKTNVNYTGNFSLQSPTVVSGVVTDGYTFAKMFRDAYFNYYGTVPAAINTQQTFSDTWLQAFSQRKKGDPEVEVGPDGKYVYYGSTDWYGELYKKNTFVQDHNVTLSGGNEKADFYISGRLYDYGGIYKYNPDNFKTLNLRAKGSLQVCDWLKIDNNLEFTNSDYHNPFVSSRTINIQRYMEVTNFPSMTMYNPDGSYTSASVYTMGAFKDGNNYQDTNKRLVKNRTGFYTKFLNNKLRVNGDFTFRSGDDRQFLKNTPVAYSTKPGESILLNSANNFIQNYTNSVMYTATNLYGEYEDTFAGKHYFKGMAGYNYETSSRKYLVTSRNGLLYPDGGSINMGFGDQKTISETVQNWQIMGLFARLNYAFNDRYLIEFNGRYDGSSKFPTNQQFAFFPSISGGWRLTEEPFWKMDKKWISDIKVRASYGSLGNGNIDPYSYMELLPIQQSGRVLNGNKYTHLSVPLPIPSGLTWETSTTTDIGLDFGLFDGRFRFSGDYYIRKTTDMYTVGMTLPDVFGADSPKGNYADLTTHGWELSLAWKDRFMLGGKPFNYSINATLSDYTAKIDKYNNQTGSLTDYYVGQTVGEIWGYKTGGLFQSEEEIKGYTNTLIMSATDRVWRPGDVKFLDLNDNKRIDYGDNTVKNPGDKVIIGNTTPRYQYSFTVGADWNNIFVSAFFQGVGKQDWYPDMESTFWGQYNRPYNNVPSWHMGNIWSEENRNAYLPRYATYNGALGRANFANDRYIQNIAYLRLKNLQVGYTLPQKWFSKIKLQNARIYLSGENLLSWSPLYKWTKNTVDVQSASSGNDSDLKVNQANGEGNSYPLMKSFSLGLSLTF